MNLQHINIKILVDGELTIDCEKFIDVFHGWIAAQSMPEMMIDVADYRHVPNGPGVVMLGHEADYFMDNAAGRPGLRYNCKIEKDGSNEDRIRQAFEATAAACARLEAELPGLSFSRSEFQLTINDRALAPNNDQTRQNVDGELPGILERIFGNKDLQIEYEQDARKLLSASVKLDQPFELTAAV